MRKMNKKAFTIVELVIVIAVIAVLAAVLVPTFIGIIRKSRVSTDTQLVRNLNTALAEDGVNNEHNTMTDVLTVAEDYGYVVANLNAKAKDNEILWDSANDVFCYLNDGKVEYLPDSVKDGKKLESGDYRLWKIYNKAPTDGEGYSIYVASQAAADYVASNDVAVGVDCGEYFIETVSYKNTGAAKKDVVIRTNSIGTTLIVNAPLDTISHYDALGTLNIIESATASYHENGKVSKAKISKGRIVLERGSEVEEIHVNAKVDAEGNKLDQFDEVIISYDSRMDLSDVTLSRDAVKIDDINGTLVVALQNGTGAITDATRLDYVWLTKQGVYEQIKVSNSSATAGDVWADAASNSATTQEVARQIANNIGETSVTIAEVAYTIAIDPDTRDLVVTNTDTGDTASENIVEAIIGGIEDESAYDSSITKVEDEIFAQSGENKDGAVCRIGMTGYASIDAAIAAAGTDARTIVLLQNIELTQKIAIPNGSNLTIDLNGKNVYNQAGKSMNIFESDNANNVGTFAVINTGAQQSRVSLTANSSNAIFSVAGTVTIGKIDDAGKTSCNDILFEGLKGGTGTAYNNYAYIFAAKNTSVYVINGGEYTYYNVTTKLTEGTANKTSANLFTGTKNTTSITINDGVFSTAIFETVGSVVINGGTFNSEFYCGSNSTVSLTVNDGTFRGKFIVSTTNTVYADAITINGGMFNGEFCTLLADKTRDNIKVFGGKFKVTNLEQVNNYWITYYKNSSRQYNWVRSFVPAGYVAKQVDGVYTVVRNQ